MKRLRNILHSNWRFLLFILVFAYIQSVHTRIVIRNVINAYVFTPESAIATLISVSILFLIILFFIKRWQKSEGFNTRALLKIFGASLITYLVILKVFGLVIALAFGNLERNFNRDTLTLSTVSHLLDGLIYGSFFLAYYYYHQNKKKQSQLVAYNHALSESKINQLKTQLNPHFLFNNLNVLDQLIEEDKNKASDFLNEFAEIYRYVLQATDKKLVTIAEELAFAAHYFKLIQHKYGNAYQLMIENPNMSGYIVPLSLQLLIENAIQHNLGTSTNPVYINITPAEGLSISNNCIPKRNAKLTSGRALSNLNEQYQLLASKPIAIQKDDQRFTVIIPIIN